MRNDIRAARISLGLTQEEVAEKTGISQGAVSRIESGILPVDPRRAPVLAKVLGLPILQILYGPEHKPDVFGPATDEVSNAA